MVGAIDAARMNADLSHLVSFKTRNSCSTTTSATQGIGAAVTYVRAAFQATGLATSDDVFSASFCGSNRTHRNEFAWIPGTDPTRLIVVGGHVDSRSTNVLSATQAAPGANDSGSQASLVMEAARVMAGHRFLATVVFITFTGEEQGLFGSANFVSRLGTYFPGAKVEAALISDIVGGDVSANTPATLQQFRLFAPGTPREASSSTPTGTPDDTSPARGILRYVGTWTSAYVPEMAVVPSLRQDRPGRGSDHISFLNAALPGVRFIEAVENTNHQHNPNDTIANMTPAYMTRVAKVVVATAAALAWAPSAPGALAVTGGGAGPIAASWTVPSSGDVDHYVIAARPVTSNFYVGRVVVPSSATSATVGSTDFGLSSDQSFFISVAAVDAAGHESLFAYPEYRCAPTCQVQPGSLDVTSSQ
jgi:hypothetical protein